jgi:hypothetical protein
MAKDLQHILEAVGFDDKEASLYLAGLKLGSAPASSYSKETNLNRITAYNVLEDLVRRGYFTINRKVQAKWYAPVAPEYVAVETRKNTDALERVLPELKSLMGAKFRKPRVRFFEGWEDAHVIPALKSLGYEVKARKTLRVIRGIEVFVKGRSKKTKVLFYG